MENPESHEDHGFRQIGSLAKPDEPSAKASGLNPDELSKNSEIIGAPCQAFEDASSTGKQLSATVAGRVQTIRETARTGTPEATDKALLASLPRSVQSSVREVREAQIDPRYGYDEVLKAFRFVEPLTPEAREASIRLVEAALAPADAMTISKELIRLRAMTKVRAEHEDDMKLLVAVYAEELANFPIDAVVGTVRQWIKREKWWPAWADLQPKLDEAVRYRTKLLDALERQRDV